MNQVIDRGQVKTTLSKVVRLLKDLNQIRYAARAGIYGYNIAFTLAAMAQNTWYNISDATISGTVSNMTHDGSGKVTVLHSGTYLIVYSVYGYVNTDGTPIFSGISINSTAELQGRSRANFILDTYTGVRGAGIIDLTAGDTMEIAVMTSSAMAPTYAIHTMSYIIKQIEV